MHGKHSRLSTLIDAVTQEDSLELSPEAVDWNANCVRCQAPSTGTFARLTVTATPCDPVDQHSYRIRHSASQAELELHILKALKHPNIVALTEPPPFFSKFQALVRATALCEATLHTVRGRAADQSHHALRGLLERLMGTVVYLHEREVAHRRIAPRHVLVPRPDAELWWREIRLSGFREATRFGSCAMVGQPAESRFRSPDMQTRITYNEKVDVWAAAATCLDVRGHQLSSGAFRAGLVAIGAGRSHALLKDLRLLDRALEISLQSALAPQPHSRRSAALTQEFLQGGTVAGADGPAAAAAAPSNGRKRLAEAAARSTSSYNDWKRLALRLKESPAELRSEDSIRSELEGAGFQPDMVARAVREILRLNEAALELRLDEGSNNVYAAHILATRVRGRSEASRTAERMVARQKAEL